jgi:hypothetical protein
MNDSLPKIEMPKEWTIGERVEIFSVKDNKWFAGSVLEKRGTSYQVKLDCGECPVIAHWGLKKEVK